MQYGISLFLKAYCIAVVNIAVYCNVVSSLDLELNLEILARRGGAK